MGNVRELSQEKKLARQCEDKQVDRRSDRQTDRSSESKREEDDELDGWLPSRT